MAIFINENSKVIVQGMTGSEGTKHTRRMLASGTKVVGGVTPGKGGQSVDIDGTVLPVFNTVAEAIAATGANASVVFVPPKLQRQRSSMRSTQRFRCALSLLKVFRFMIQLPSTRWQLRPAPRV